MQIVIHRTSDSSPIDCCVVISQCSNTGKFSLQPQVRSIHRRMTLICWRYWTEFKARKHLLDLCKLSDLKPFTQSVPERQRAHQSHDLLTVIWEPSNSLWRRSRQTSPTPQTSCRPLQVNPSRSIACSRGKCSKCLFSAANPSRRKFRKLRVLIANSH